MRVTDNRFAFDTVLRDAALAAALNLRRADEARADVLASQPGLQKNVTTLSVIAGLAVMSAIIFATGYAALMSETPGVWIHRLMALTVAQSILIAAAAIKLAPLVERRHLSVRIFPNLAVRHAPALEAPERIPDEDPAPLPPPAIKRPFVGGKLAGREFLEFHDGSIEIDTLVGRRRFISLDAAREFVGA